MISLVDSIEHVFDFMLRILFGSGVLFITMGYGFAYAALYAVSVARLRLSARRGRR